VQLANVVRSMNPFPIVRATIARHRGTYLLFTALVAVATAIGVAITTQEAALRIGSARAADKFDLVVAAPGSETDVVLAAIYLRPGTVPLLEPGVVGKVLAEQRAKISAPLGFGDNFKGSPIVGTVPDFVDHLSGGLSEGRVFATEDEAVAGAAAPLAIGETFRPEHGRNPFLDALRVQHSATLTVTGRMKPTGTPWDNSVIVPIESVWRVHGLPTGHADGELRIGPPFDPAHVPGVPAIVMKPENVNAAYGLRNLYRTPLSMAFFPAEALVRLYEVLGDIRELMSWLALAAQGLVVVAILAGVTAILTLHRRQFAVLRALGAPRLYIFLCVWTQIAVVATLGALIGLALGAGAAVLVSRLITQATGVVLPARIGPDELLLVGGMIIFGLIVATIPALISYRRSAIQALTS
jgi:putative ABC transport system permease protein